MKAAIYTLGCKVNQYESEYISQQLKGDLIEIVPYSEIADIYIINSCTVTAESDKKTRQAVRKFKRKNPDAVVVLTGCLPQTQTDIFDLLTEADIVTGNNNNEGIIPAIRKFLASKERISDIRLHESGEPFSCGVINDFSERTRAIVKIEDGCNRFCSYCIIPYARGRVRSKPLEILKEELSTLDSKGFKEIVLVGINLSSYGLNTDFNICDAVEMAESFESFRRIRLGSLEPDHLTDEIIERLSKCKKLCPQFHISLQSGCNKTLKEMNRHYTAEEYYALSRKLRECFKNATITTDIMVGFPNESDEDFEESLNFAYKVGFEKMHVFPYSPREGTPAAKKVQVNPQIKEKRSHIMLAAANEIRSEFLKNQIGKTVNVLFENDNEGYTENYTPVKVYTDVECGSMLKVKITESDNDYCYGEITE